MNKFLLASTTIFMAANVHTCANAAKWQWKLPIAAAKSGLQVEVCPLKYGKTWAYSFEIDDGPASTLAVSQPLLARYQWNDAPPGAAGGTLRPFVGGAAVILGSINTGNSTGLTYEQLDQLKKSGWSFLNHSYWHSGNHWDPANFLKPEDFKRELFWSQTIFAELLNDGRGATHFVFPNGDYHYGPYLEAYGLRSATRVGGSSPHNLRDSKLNFLDFNRNYLDESVWSQSNNSLSDLPAQPQAGDFIIDFTHGMDGDAQSANNKRWIERLNHIAKNWGPQGDNSMWVAPTDEVVNYSLAARAAKATLSKGKLKIDLPDTVSGSALTLKISGVGEKTLLQAPAGTTLYRREDTVWLTTPIIGQSGAPPLAPRVRRIYVGEIKNLAWKKPVAIAGVRIRQFGPGAKDFVLKIDAITPEGKVESVLPKGELKLSEVWGGWNLYPALPDRPAIVARELHVTPGKDLNEMEVWAVQDTATTR
jgi:hypothetical protein